VDRMTSEALLQAAHAPAHAGLDRWENGGVAGLGAADALAWRPAEPAPPDLADSEAAMTALERQARLTTTLEADIIPRLIDRLRPAAPLAPAGAANDEHAGPPVTDADVAAFCKLALSGDAETVCAAADDLLARGLTEHRLFEELLGPVARRLGAMWEDDTCDFMDVTIGLGRLQQVVRRLAAPPREGLTGPSGLPSVLLTAAPGEQHTFGLTLVAECFERAGWQVTVCLPGAERDVLAVAASTAFDVVGFSVGSTHQKLALRDLIAKVRIRSRNPRVGVMVGGPLFRQEPGLAADLGADVCASDARQAAAAAQNMLTLALQRG
jgi:MerR family transcriptional regulator, light-induced transcriptional regulator